MRERTAGHVISLSISDGGLQLLLHPDTLVQTEEKIRVDDPPGIGAVNWWY